MCMRSMGYAIFQAKAMDSNLEVVCTGAQIKEAEKYQVDDLETVGT